jgi:hypothetical protein
MSQDVARALIALSDGGVPVGKGVLTKEILTTLGLPMAQPHIARVQKGLRSLGWRCVRMMGYRHRKLRGAATAWYPMNSFAWRDNLPA